MPPPRKIDLIPAELREWLREMLKKEGFGNYEKITEDLNFRLEEEGLELRLGKSSVHAFGQEFRQYAEAQEQAQEEIRAFLEEANLQDEVDVTSALFQQLTTIQWKLQMALTRSGDLDPRDLKFLTDALNNLVKSTDLREQLAAKARAALEVEQNAALAKAVDGGRIDQKAAQRAREILGFV